MLTRSQRTLLRAAKKVTESHSETRLKDSESRSWKHKVRGKSKLNLSSTQSKMEVWTMECPCTSINLLTPYSHLRKNRWKDFLIVPWRKVLWRRRIHQAPLWKVALLLHERTWAAVIKRTGIMRINKDFRIISLCCRTSKESWQTRRQGIIPSLCLADLLVLQTSI